MKVLCLSLVLFLSQYSFSGEISEMIRSRQGGVRTAAAYNPNAITQSPSFYDSRGVGADGAEHDLAKCSGLHRNDATSLYSRGGVVLQDDGTGSHIR